MRNHSLICTMVFLASLSLAGCDDGGGGGSAGTPEEFFAKANDKFCAFQVSCGTFPDVATCKATTFDDGGQATILSGVKAGEIDFNEDKAAACLDAFGALTCELVFSPAVQDFAEKCGAVFTGHVAVGGACVDSEECADENSCAKPDTCGDNDQCCAGVCEVRPKGTVPLGGDCSENPACAAGSYCKQEAAGSTCVAQVDGVGTVCDSFLACKAPLVCNIDFQTGSGTCYQPAARDATCDPNVLFGACAEAADYCDTATSKCLARGKDGDACSVEAPESCVTYAFCDAGTCKNRPVVGGACGTSGTDPECLGDLVCTTNACAAPPAAVACP